MTNTYVAKFEATTDKNDCRVWAWGACNVADLEYKTFGHSIDEFFNWCAGRENYKVLFHKLEIDGQFLIAWLFKNGFKHTTEQTERKTRTFNTLINNKGIYYQIEVIFERKGKTINKVTFQNSYNLIPLNIERIAETFKLPIPKLKIDYEVERTIEHKLTKDEEQCISNDVEIVARGVQYFYEQGLTKMTIGACALDDFKRIMGHRKFRMFFPSPDYDWDVRQSYRGGYTYLEPEYEGKVLKNGIVLDINSTHPYTMYSCPLPYGDPLFFEGRYVHDELYPLYVQAVRCQFELKEGFVPTVQIRYGSDFNPSEYLRDSGGGEVVLWLTNIDLEIFYRHYNVYNEKFFGGWKFKSTIGLFDDYVEKWTLTKVQSRRDANWGLYEISKFMLNSLYGKFGTLPTVKSKIPYISKDGVVDYKDGYPEEIEGIYLGVATFITSYSRQRIINAFQQLKDDYNAGRSNIIPVYTDTDSLHCLTDDFSIPQSLEIDDAEIGKFKVEGIFRKAKFLKQKCYIQEFQKKNENDFKMKITVAGMPESCYDQVTFENFKVGTTYKGKQVPVRVPGGVVLGDIDFTIKMV